MAKSKILVVDDDPKLSRLVRLVLEKTDLYEVSEENRATNVLARAKGLRPDAILLDVDMPEKDGGQVAKEIAADSTLRQTPVMFLTSLISSSDGREVMAGGVRFLAKPVNPATLISAVGRLVSSSMSMAAHV